MSKRTIIATSAALFAAGRLVTAAHAADVKCSGSNACKGQSACKMGNSAYKGQNCLQGPRLVRSREPG